MQWSLEWRRAYWCCNQWRSFPDYRFKLGGSGIRIYMRHAYERSNSYSGLYGVHYKAVSCRPSADRDTTDRRQMQSVRLVQRLAVQNRIIPVKAQGGKALFT